MEQNINTLYTASFDSTSHDFQARDDAEALQYGDEFANHYGRIVKVTEGARLVSYVQPQPVARPSLRGVW